MPMLWESDNLLGVHVRWSPTAHRLHGQARSTLQRYPGRPMPGTRQVASGIASLVGNFNSTSATITDTPKSEDEELK